MDKLCEYSGEDIQLGSTSLQFSQQKKSGKSVVDGFISQESIKIAVETKLFDKFSPTQLKNHLAIFGSEQHKLLILLNPAPSSVNKRQFNLVQDTAQKENIQVVHTSFEEIIDSARKCLSGLDEEMHALVDDYESFCSGRGLLPRDKYTLFVPPCRESFNANQKYRLYYCPTSRSLRNAKYLGIYKDRSVRLIGQIVKVVVCTVDTKSRAVQ
jgi:macrodomain Ter protein organizer (MatP/YcbG family)